MRSIILLLFFGSVGLHAAPVEWTLENVQFDDGGTASGSFVYDQATQEYSAVSVQTTAGSSFSGGAYSYGVIPELAPDIPPGGAIGLLPVPLFSGLDIDSLMSMQFASVLTDAGGTRVLIGSLNQETPCPGPGAVCPSSGTRNIIAGQVTAVPIPAAFWLFVSSIAVAVRYRKKIAA
jgi:hypothetical protein